MSFRWVFGDSSESFATKGEAEDWMGAEFQRLLDDGYLVATLMDGDEELYTMKLTADP